MSEEVYECVTDNMVGIQQRLMALQRERMALVENLNMHRDRVGKLECLLIIKHHINVSEVDTKIKQLRESTARISHLPLICFATEDGIRYDVILTRIDRAVVGDYEHIEDLMTKMDTEKALVLRGNVNALEERLLANSIEVYDSLTTNAKKTGKSPSLRGLTISKVRKYLYHYTLDKHKVLGFVAVRSQKSS